MATVPKETCRYRQHDLTPNRKWKKASSTQGCSRTVPQFSTDRALRRLTAEFERDPVYSARYGRWRSSLVAVSNIEKCGAEIAGHLRLDAAFTNGALKSCAAATCNSDLYRAKIQKKTVYSSRFVRVILAQGPC